VYLFDIVTVVSGYDRRKEIINMLKGYIAANSHSQANNALKKVKVKVKSLFTGLSSTLRLPGSMTSGSIVFLPLASSSRIHLQRRNSSCRCARPLPAKAGTFPPLNFAIRAENTEKLMGSFSCRKAGTWDIFCFPSEGRHTEDFLDA
jgi:hypothetical protein